MQLRAMRDEMLEDLKDLRSKQRDKYMKTLSNLILQSMIRMLEPEIYIMCREEDKDEDDAMVSDLQSEYSTFMNEKTGRDYETKINVIDDRFLTDDKDLGCGGVIVYNSDKTITQTEHQLRKTDPANKLTTKQLASQTEVWDNGITHEQHVMQELNLLEQHRHPWRYNEGRVRTWHTIRSPTINGT